MLVQRLRNLLAQKTRNVSRRLQRALEEVSEALANEHHHGHGHPTPVPIPVPVRNGGAGGSGGGRRGFPGGDHGMRCAPMVFGLCGLQFVRCLSGAGEAAGFGSSGTNWTYHRLNYQFHNGGGNRWFGKYKIFQKFFNTKSGTQFRQGLKILHGLKNNHGFMFHNFSQAYQNGYRAKMYHVNVKLVYRTVFNNLREKFQIYPRYQQLESCQRKFNPTIRLNLSLTPKHHHLTLKLAKADSTATIQERIQSNQINVGTYIDFPVGFQFSIPNETILSDEILEEMMFNIRMFEKKLHDLKQDILNLFELGELPIKYIADKNVLRVYFPNCDRARLESLCQEKSIVGGTIYEDVDGLHEESSSVVAAAAVATTTASTRLHEAVEEEPAAPPMTASSTMNTVDSGDILSSYYYQSAESHRTSCDGSDSITEFDDDVLSSSSDNFSPLSDSDIVRPHDLQMPENINFQFPEPQQVAIQTVENGNVNNFDEYDEYYWISASY